LPTDAGKAAHAGYQVTLVSYPNLYSGLRHPRLWMSTFPTSFR